MYKLNVVICKQGVYINRLINKGFRRAKFEFWSTLLACVYVLKVSINRIMANTAIANDFHPELFSELEEPLVQPLLLHWYGCTICKRRRQELFPTNKWENFEGMKKVGRKFKETVCGPPSKLTLHWIPTGGISLRSRHQFTEHQNENE